MATGTRNQEMHKLAAALEEQDKAMIELRSNTSSRLDQLMKMISGLTLQQNRLMTQLQSGTGLYRCEQFFEVDMTPDDVKMKLVSIHVEGRALQWHQAYVRSLGVERKMVNWNEYVIAVVSRFGDSGYEDPMVDLKNLRQAGLVQDYMTEFNALLNRVTITESDALSHFLGD
ncbi:hypothetical protein CRG98_030819 [Punica granatum]|uniref:Retrotransposon gag domain-containing protein n=1 Tax=Punica granatum TaxID=22663 RepID=A0A2I0IXP9_PUNGR|nr:hypothetical protein CRG98_030819 [Punica granatum]